MTTIRAVVPKKNDNDKKGKITSGPNAVSLPINRFPRCPPLDEKAFLVKKSYIL